jgi:hypothetical protein
MWKSLENLFPHAEGEEKAMKLNDPCVKTAGE